MSKVTQTSSRKSDHIQINLEKDVNSSLTTGLEQFHFTHEALPDLNLKEINTQLDLFNKKLASPLLISSMTGGTPEAQKINLHLAEAAQEKGIAMGLGSQRAALEESSLANTFKVRQIAPDILLFANLGAVQLNYGYGIDECIKVIEMIEADGLILHFNALQEAVQPEGDTNFYGLLSKIEQICKKLPEPIIAKEVGWGFSGQTAKRLFEAGVRAIDVAGAGGTSWSQVEMYRTKNERQVKIAKVFDNWGIPTAESIIQINETVPEMIIFASGGLRSGIDVAKCIALGAKIGGMAGPFLKAASISTDAVVQTIEDITNQLQICMFAAGIKNLDVLGNAKLIKR